MFNPQNNQCHLDIEDDIERIKNGLMTVSLRVNNKAVSDYVLIENDTTQHSVSQNTGREDK